jgi:predicted Zn-dependent protease
VSKPICRPRPLTAEQNALALRRSVEINPANAAERREMRLSPIGRRGGERRLVLVVGHRWPASGVRLSVQFLDAPSLALRKRILAHMNAWSKFANVRFDETRATGQVRIARLDAPASMAGYWSYLGTQIEAIPEDEPTLNLDSFTMRTPESEFRRVVRHEAGHTLGFEHEHLRSELITRIDRRKAFAYYDRTEGWDREVTIEQVLTPLATRSITGTTEVDPLSIMCYQIPAEITKDGKEIPGGTDITARDRAFAATVYPPASTRRDGSADETAREEASRIDAAIVDTPAVDADTFQLLILDPFDSQADSDEKTRPLAQRARAESGREPPYFLRVLASYGGARAHFAMPVRKQPDGAATRFGRIIATHERIKQYTDAQRGKLPDEKALMEFGGNLFETLFDGDVRRLYDEARARQHGRRLDLILTSMVSWIAEKPWEFAYDTTRRSFLATEEIQFVRNVVTCVPADRIAPKRGPLRILVVAAQPIGAGRL